MNKQSIAVNSGEVANKVNSALSETDVILDEKKRKERADRIEMAVLYGKTANFRVKFVYKEQGQVRAMYGIAIDFRKSLVTLKGGVKLLEGSILEVVFP